MDHGWKRRHLLCRLGLNGGDGASGGFGVAFGLKSFLLGCISNSPSHELDYASAGTLPWAWRYSRDIYRESFLIA